MLGINTLRTPSVICLPLALRGGISVSCVCENHRPPRVIISSATDLSISPTFCHCTSVRDRHVPLPCYWPKQSDGLSTSRSLCSLPLRAGQKTSICSSTSVQTAAAEDTAKHGFSDTQRHTGLLPTVSACRCHQTTNKTF